jgi:hypothetical protein
MTIPNSKFQMQNRQGDARLAKNVALSCQILAKLGLFKETTGHVSARRTSGAAMLIRGRGREESGLLFTKARDVVAADFAGQKLDKRSVLKTPNESVIHGEIYKARPNVGAIVHAHPPSIVLTSMAGIKLRPIFGGFDPRAGETVSPGSCAAKRHRRLELLLSAAKGEKGRRLSRFVAVKKLGGRRLLQAAARKINAPSQ